MKKIVHLSVIAMMCLLPVSVQAQSLATRAKNAVRTTVPRVKVQQPGLLHAGNSQTVIQYTDGLGMPTIAVAPGVTPLGNRLVTLTANDFNGKPVEEWLPVPVAGTGIPEPDAVKQAAQAFYDDTNPYTRCEYGMFSSITPPGQDWHGNNKKRTAGYDIANIDHTYPLDRVNKYRMASETSVQKTGLWEELTLDSYLTEDEEGRKTYSYSDQTNRLVLRRVMEGEIVGSGNSCSLNGTFYDTYYIYNDKGQLACVLPPEASKRMTNNKTYTQAQNNSSNPLDGYAYFYRYDGFGRCTAKKPPGAGWVYFVYDQAHRLILTQTALQRITNEWSFCKYDRFGRLIQSGTTQNTATHQTLQNTYTNLVVTESWQTGTGYTNNYSLGNNTAILTQNYYDSYNFLNRPAYNSIKNDLTYVPVAGFDSIYTRIIEGEDISLRGVLTGTAVSLVGMTGEQLTALYYDRNGKVIQSRSNNHLGGYDKHFFRYNFSGDLLKQKHLHKVANKTEIAENYEYTYDNDGRPIETWHAIDNLTPIKISKLEYDEACRVKKKTFHGGAYAMNYNYNVHNQLKSITSPRFSQSLIRQNSATHAYYDGKISELQDVQNGSTSITRYDYDALKRLTSATCSNHAFDMQLRYDANGNITDLNRYALIHDYSRLDSDGYEDVRIDVMDSLHFEYTGNIPWYVCGNYKEESPSYFPQSTEPWISIAKNRYPSASNYLLASDVNGNRTGDENRQIAWIKYNSLNLVWKVQGMTGNKTEYVYDATGAKRRTIETTPMNPMQIPLGATGTESTNIKTTNTTDYCGNFRYYNGNLKYILTPDGYIDASNASSSNWKHRYAVKDYQGNVRMELTSATLSNPTSTAYTSGYTMVYYPFGLKEYNGNILFQYGGNEVSKDRDNSLDFHFRRLDPQLCRFTTQDPLAELDYSTSPYAYCGNDPINFIDPLGLWASENTISTSGGEAFDGGTCDEVVVTGKRSEGAPKYLYGGSFFSESNLSSLDDLGWDMEGSHGHDPEYERMMQERAELDRKLGENFRENTMEGVPRFEERNGVYYNSNGAVIGEVPLKNVYPEFDVLVIGKLISSAIAIAAKGGGQTFEIADGVRRAKAAQELGHTSIKAMDHTGKTFQVPIKDLYSPFKNSIDVSTPMNQFRYDRIYNGFKAGDALPPIYVNPGSRGISIFDIYFIH